VHANVTKVNQTISMANVSPLYPCHSVPCQNGGACLDGKCQCQGNYDGLLCEVDRCANVNCQNGGFCFAGKCRCDNTFKGEYCERDACQDINCGPYGTCKYGECVCLPDYGGKYCEDQSLMGVKRQDMLKSIGDLTDQIRGVDLTLPRVRNLTAQNVTQEIVTNSTGAVIERVSRAVRDIVNTASNSYAAPPRQLKDGNGEYKWHQQTPPDLIKKRIDAVALPKKGLVTKLRPLVKADELNRNATADHTDFPKEMTRLESLALAEGEAEVEETTEADEAEEVEERAHEVTSEAESEEAFFF
jgi:hypothetical protein